MRHLLLLPALLLAGCSQAAISDIAASDDPARHTQAGMQALAEDDFERAALAFGAAARPEQTASAPSLSDRLTAQTGQQETSAPADDPEAQRMLALLTLHGLGTAQSGSAALALFLRAAARDDAAAQAQLGVMYERGIGTGPDPAIAYAWYALASLHQNPDGLQGMTRVAETMTDDELRRGRTLFSTLQAEFIRVPQEESADGHL